MPENEPVPTENLTQNLTQNLSDKGYCPPARARLVIFEGVEAGRIVDLEEAELRVGRMEGNDLILPSNKVSKRHLQISWAPDGIYRAEDLGSTNGVLVNGRKLHAGEKRILQHGDTVRVSDHLLLFHHPRSASERRLGFESIQLDQAKIDADVQAAFEKLEQMDNLVLPKRPSKDDAE
ncbi:MAG: FHA domain-containing protein [Planctomycetota bacterium]